MAQDLFANIAALQSRPFYLHEPSLISLPANLKVEREILNFECRRMSTRIICNFVAEYFLNNRNDQGAELIGGFYSVFTDNVQIFHQGKNISTKLTDAQSQELQGLLNELKLKKIPADQNENTSTRKNQTFVDANSIQRTKLDATFRLKLNAGEQTSVIAKGEIHPECKYKPGYRKVFLGVFSRHPFLHFEKEECEVNLLYYLAPIKTFNEFGQIEVKINFPGDWQHDLGDYKNRGRFNTDLYRFEKNEPGHLSFIIGAANSHQEAKNRSLPDYLSVNLTAPHSDWFFGGITFDIGGSFGHGFLFGSSLDLGYGDYLGVSFSHFGNFQDSNSFAVMPQLISPWVFVLPSFSLGLAPVLLYEKETSYWGARAQFAATISMIGAVFQLDYFSGLSQPWRFALLGRISF